MEHTGYIDYVKISDTNTEILSLDDVKQHLRIDTDFDDAVITAFIVAAKDYVENFLNGALTTQVWEAVLDHWLPKIQLYMFPIVSIDSIIYSDMLGTEYTLDSTGYNINLNSRPAVITRPVYTCWPLVILYPTGAIHIQFTAGYASAADIPQAILLAMKMLISQWYENREPVITGTSSNVGQLPFAVEALLRPYRLQRW